MISVFIFILSVCCCFWHIICVIAGHTVCTWILFTTFTLISDSPSLSSSIRLRLWLAMRHIRSVVRFIFSLVNSQTFFLSVTILDVLKASDIEVARDVFDSTLICTWRGSQHTMMIVTRIGVFGNVCFECFDRMYCDCKWFNWFL